MWKNFLPTSKKIKKKNQISKYYTSSPKGMMRKIQDQSMKNLLIQWDTEEENQKILSMFGKKTSQPWRETEEENRKGSSNREV